MSTSSSDDDGDLYEKIPPERIDLLLKQFEKYAYEPLFLTLSPPQLKYLIYQDDINVSWEIIVYEAVIRWIKYAYGRDTCTFEMIKYVRFDLLPLDHILDVVEEEPVIKALIDDDSPRGAKMREILSKAKAWQKKPHHLRPLNIRPYRSWPRSAWAENPTIKALYVFGASGDRLSHVERYDFIAEEWTRLDASIPFLRPGIATFQKRIWFVGGTRPGAGSQTAVFSFGSTEPAWREEEPMRQARHDHGVVVIGERLYAVGGFDTNTGTLNSVERLSHESGEWKWENCADMNEKRRGHGVAVSGSRIYAAGGSNDTAPTLDTIELYKSTTDQWSVLKRMGRHRGECCAVAHDGWVYVFGGESVGVIEAHNCVSEQPRDVANLIENGRYMSAVFYGGGIWSLVSDEAGGKTTSFQYYQPTTDGWRDPASPADDVHADGARCVLYDAKTPSFKLPPGALWTSKIHHSSKRTDGADHSRPSSTRPKKTERPRGLSQSSMANAAGRQTPSGQPREHLRNASASQNRSISSESPESQHSRQSHGHRRGNRYYIPPGIISRRSSLNASLDSNYSGLNGSSGTASSMMTDTSLTDEIFQSFNNSGRRIHSDRTDTSRSRDPDDSWSRQSDSVIQPATLPDNLLRDYVRKCARENPLPVEAAAKPSPYESIKSLWDDSDEQPPMEFEISRPQWPVEWSRVNYSRPTDLPTPSNASAASQPDQEPNLSTRSLPAIESSSNHQPIYEWCRGSHNRITPPLASSNATAELSVTDQGPSLSTRPLPAIESNSNNTKRQEAPSSNSNQVAVRSKRRTSREKRLQVSVERAFNLAQEFFWPATNQDAGSPRQTQASNVQHNDVGAPSCSEQEFQSSLRQGQNPPQASIEIALDTFQGLFWPSTNQNTGSPRQTQASNVQHNDVGAPSRCEQEFQSRSRKGPLYLRKSSKSSPKTCSAGHQGAADTSQEDSLLASNPEDNRPRQVPVGHGSMGHQGAANISHENSLLASNPEDNYSRHTVSVDLGSSSEIQLPSSPSKECVLSNSDLEVGQSSETIPTEQRASHPVEKNQRSPIDEEFSRLKQALRKAQVRQTSNDGISSRSHETSPASNRQTKDSKQPARGASNEQNNVSKYGVGRNASNIGIQESKNQQSRKQEKSKSSPLRTGSVQPTRAGKSSPNIGTQKPSRPAPITPPCAPCPSSSSNKNQRPYLKSKGKFPRSLDHGASPISSCNRSQRAPSTPQRRIPSAPSRGGAPSSPRVGMGHAPSSPRERFPSAPDQGPGPSFPMTGLQNPSQETLPCLSIPRGHFFSQGRFPCMPFQGAVPNYPIAIIQSETTFYLQPNILYAPNQGPSWPGFQTASFPQQQQMQMQPRGPMHQQYYPHQQVGLQPIVTQEPHFIQRGLLMPTHIQQQQTFIQHQPFVSQQQSQGSVQQQWLAQQQPNMSQQHQHGPVPIHQEEHMQNQQDDSQQRQHGPALTQQGHLQQYPNMSQWELFMQHQQVFGHQQLQWPMHLVSQQLIGQQYDGAVGWDGGALVQIMAPTNDQGHAMRPVYYPNPAQNTGRPERDSDDSAYGSPGSSPPCTPPRGDSQEEHAVAYPPPQQQSIAAVPSTPVLGYPIPHQSIFVSNDQMQIQPRMAAPNANQNDGNSQEEHAVAYPLLQQQSIAVVPSTPVLGYPIHQQSIFVSNDQMQIQPYMAAPNANPNDGNSQEEHAVAYPLLQQQSFAVVPSTPVLGYPIPHQAIVVSHNVRHIQLRMNSPNANLSDDNFQSMLQLVIQQLPSNASRTVVYSVLNSGEYDFHTFLVAPPANDDELGAENQLQFQRATAVIGVSRGGRPVHNVYNFPPRRQSAANENNTSRSQDRDQQT